MLVNKRLNGCEHMKIFNDYFSLILIVVTSNQSTCMSSALLLHGVINRLFTRHHLS